MSECDSFWPAPAGRAHLEEKLHGRNFTASSLKTAFGLE